MKAAEVETETALLGLEIDGFCVIESVIPAEAVGRVRDAVVASIEERQAAGHTNPAGNTTFINVNQDAAEYFADPRVLGVVERCFGPVPHTRIGGTSCVIHEPSQPSERAKLGPTGKGGLHSDWPGRLYQSPMWSSDRGPPPPGFDRLLAPAAGQSIMTDIQAFFILTDFSESNGGTMVRPGSHRHASDVIQMRSALALESLWPSALSTMDQPCALAIRYPMVKPRMAIRVFQFIEAIAPISLRYALVAVKMLKQMGG